MASHLDIRGDLDYVDQVPRLLAYRDAHPDVEIICCGPYWKAIILDGDDGSTEINRLSLKWLMDKLDSLAADPAPIPPRVP